MELGFILSDLGTNLERVADHCSNLAICTIEAAEGAFEMHRYTSRIKKYDEEEFEEKALSVLRSGWYIMGKELESFEKEFASYTGAEYVLNDTVEGALVPNEKGTGIVDVNPSAYTADFHFLYEYTPGQGLFQWTSDGWLLDDAEKKPYRIKGAKIYFTSGLVNRDKFKREVFDLEPEQYDRFPVIVETRAAKDVTVEDIQTASCVIMHKGNDMFCLGQTPLTYKKDSRDLSLAVCKAIVDRVMGFLLSVSITYNLK